MTKYFTPSIVSIVATTGKGRVLVDGSSGNVVPPRIAAQIISDLVLGYADLDPSEYSEFEFREEVVNVRHWMRQGHGSFDDVRYVYLMESGGLHKIGLSFDPHTRMKNVKKPGDCIHLIHMEEVRNPVALEMGLHVHFRDHHSHGEWFHLDDEQVDEAIRHMRVWAEIAEFMEGEG